MSYGCMFVLRNVKRGSELCVQLERLAINNGYAINFSPVNNLLLANAVEIAVHDFVFEICDDLHSRVAALLLSYDGFLVNGEKAKIPLKERLMLIQNLVEECRPYANEIDIFLGEDTPCLSDFTHFCASYTEIANIIYREYCLNAGDVRIPCVHLRTGS